MIASLPRYPLKTIMMTIVKDMLRAKLLHIILVSVAMSVPKRTLYMVSIAFTLLTEVQGQVYANAVGNW